MKISLRWLGDFVDVREFLSDPRELVRRLTAAGFEVDAVENPADHWKHVVTAQIKKLERHPNADRLTVCQVDVGDGVLRQIVCGAKNHKEGDKVVASLPGAVLPGNFAIKKSKIRDVESQGMLASESELGLKKESDGILILPADAPIGEALAKYLGRDDVLMEINVSPNRSDCLSHLGLAREIAALLKRPLIEPDITLQAASKERTKERVRLSVQATDLCPRYTGRLITNLKVGPSPDFLRQRLEAVGLNSINNVVDITNYVMMELGQPLHAFDLAQLKGHRIIVDRAHPKEPFVSLDGSEYILSGDELTIRDSERAVCLAGVVGGRNSGVGESTTSVFLESAHFAMDSVRRTSRRLGLQTDSAYRFSRGIDPSQVIRALNRACQLFEKYADGQVAQDFYDERLETPQKQPISIALDHVSERLGFEATAEEFSDWMKRLGCQVEKVDSSHFRVTPPDFRGDLEMKEDLIEEFGRLQGYDCIPEKLPLFGSAPLPHAPEYVFDTLMSRAMEDEGFQQAVNYGFIGSKFQSEFLGSERTSKPIKIRNPLNEELNVMRSSLVPWLFRNFVYNVRHGMSQGRLYENGFVFHEENGEFIERQRLAMLNWGVSSGLWQKSETPVFFELKSALENIFQRLRVGGPKGVLKAVAFQSLELRPLEDGPPFLHPGQSASVFCEGKSIGYLGAVHPLLLADEKVTVSAAIAELDVSVLRRGQPRPVKFQPISKQPSVERDFAFLLPDQVSAGQVAAEMRKLAGASAQSVEIFDVFQGEGLPEGFRSVGYRMVFQDPVSTLTEDQLTRIQQELVSAVTKKFQLKTR